MITIPMKTSSKFRLFKRGDDGRELDPSAEGYRDRFYYFRFTYRGKAYPRCLETNDATEAQRRAKQKYAEIVAAVSAGSYARLDATKLRAPKSASLTDLFTAYRTGPSEANAATRELNINALKQLVGTDCQAVRELTPGVARKFFENIQTKILATNDQEAVASFKRSANSRWAQAKSLFTDRCLSHYQDKELIPAGTSGRAGLEAFVKAGDNARFNRIPKQNYHPPSEDIIRATFAAWEKLEDRNLFLAIGHELAFGLRLAEMAQAKWNWHTERAGYPVLDGRAAVKNGSGLIQIRALDPWFTTLQTTAILNHWWGQPGEADEFIIQGTDTYRTDGLFRAVSDWLRQLGWETQKTNHALRAYAGSQIAMKYGIYEAQMFLRHSTVKVTEQNYSHFVSKFKPSDQNHIAARWATLDAKVTSCVPDYTLDATADFRKTPLDSSTVTRETSPRQPIETDKSK